MSMLSYHYRPKYYFRAVNNGWKSIDIDEEKVIAYVRAIEMHF